MSAARAEKIKERRENRFVDPERAERRAFDKLLNHGFYLGHFTLAASQNS